MNKTEVKALVADYNKTRIERLKLDNESKKLKVKEDSLMDKLIAAKVVSGTYGPYLLTYEPKKAPRVTDWSLFYAYIQQENAFEMLHKRLTETAIMERVNAGEIVPGIVVDNKPAYKVSAA